LPYNIVCLFVCLFAAWQVTELERRMVEMNKSATELTEAVTNIKVALQVCLRGPVRTYAHCTEARNRAGPRVDALVCAVGARLCALHRGTNRAGPHVDAPVCAGCGWGSAVCCYSGHA
jgi:hypothetical protein